MSEMEGFAEEFKKQAIKLPSRKALKSITNKVMAHAGRKTPKGYGKTFWEGAKASVPWTLGFGALEAASKGPHISLDTPEQRKKNIMKDIATGATGFGAWDVASKAIGPKKKSGLSTLYRMSRRGRGRKGLRLLPKALKRVPRSVGAIGAGLVAAGAAENLMGKLFKKEPSVEIPLQARRR